MKRSGIVALLLCAVQFSTGQEVKVTGKVFNLRNKAPVEGAVVEAFDTDRKAFTDPSGFFALDIPAGCSMLVIDHINFDKKEVRLSGSYWKKLQKIGLTDSIWHQNNDGPRSERILTSEEEYWECIVKRGRKYYVDKDYRVIYILKNEGDTIWFTKRYPARITTEGVSGMPQEIIKYDVPPDSVVFNKDATIKALWKDGVRYELITQDERGYICYNSDYLIVPFEDLCQVKVRHNSPQKKFGIANAVIGPVIAGIIIYSVSQSIENRY
jgi:hypothetical protein